jgi:saccharopine dehydrogenase (NAD+, L-lysine-forming)
MIYHEEMESLVKHLPHLRRIRFFMTFGDSYLWHVRVLQNVGMIGIEPVEFEGHKIIPIKFLKALLPKGEDFNQTYTGKTCIGCVISGIKDARRKDVFIYQVCDHREAFLETGGNAIGYTTAIPTVTAAKLILEGKWGRGVYGVRNTEDPVFDSKIFLEELAVMGLPWKIVELDAVPEPLRRNY